MKNPIGQTLLHQFRVDAFVAAGGMGAIYKVWDLKRNVYLAMKILHADLADEPAILKRFQREARALKKLAHPNIVPFYGLYETSEYKFLLEAYIDGFSLKEILAPIPGKPFTVTETITYLKAICAALGYAHAHKVVHCDVKPGNVMIDGSGKVYLTDFGIARHAESTLTTLATSGTTAYMAPEQILGDPVSAKTDVYALGILLFELLTGRRPFRGDGQGEQETGATLAEKIRFEHLNIQPADPGLLNPILSTELCQVVLKALAKEPSQRYASVLELYTAALQTQQGSQQFISDQVPVPNMLYSHPTSPETPISKRRTKHQTRIVWGFTIMIVLIIIVLGLVGMSSGIMTGRFAVSSLLARATEELMLSQEVDDPATARPVIAKPTLTVTPKAQNTPTKTVTQFQTALPTKEIFAKSPTPLARSNAQAKPTYFPLNNCNASRLHVGDWAYIAFGGGRNAIRSKADVGDKYNKIGFAEEGEVINLIGGPTCSYNWVVWEVRTAKGLKGWTPEGDEKDFWLIPGITWNPCAGSPASRLQAGQLAQVSQYPDVPNNVRQSPDKDAARLGQIPPGEVIKIREGPICADGMIWWRVRSQSSNLVGWTAEGDARNYWLAPMLQP